MKLMKLFKQSRIVVGIVLILIFVLSLIAVKPWLIHPSNKDELFLVVGTAFKAPDICGKINRWAYIRGDLFDLWSGFGPDYVRSECYTLVVAHTHDPLLCEQVSSLTQYFIFSGQYSRKKCLEYIINPLDSSTSAGYVASLPEFMRQLGFPIERVRNILLADPLYFATRPKGPESEEELYWDFYAKLAYEKNPDNLEKKEFLEAVRRL